jgi:hypothetical protein
LECTTWIDPLPLTATTAFSSQEIFSLFLQAILADPDSAPLFMTYYEKGVSFFIAYFAFHGAHFIDSPIYAFYLALLFIQFLWFARSNDLLYQSHTLQAVCSISIPAHLSIFI